jgi:hypothetical protein
MTDTRDINLRIGLLRQWLNEDRITDPKKMVTNEDLHHWLDEAIESALEAERKRIKVALEEEVRAILKEESGDE